MQSTRDSMLGHVNPLGRKTNWIVIAIEAVALLALGIYVLTDKSRAGTAILQITSLVLLVAGVVAIVAEFRSGMTGQVLYTAFRAGIGVAIGAIGTARWFWDYLPLNALRLILGWGLLAYAVLSVAALLIARKQDADNWGGLAVAGMTAALGIILLLNNETNSRGTLMLLGIVFLIAGILLVGIAYLRYKATQGATV